MVTPDGHDEIFHSCGDRCNSFTGHPGEWPVPLPDKEGRTVYHHTKCVANRLREAALLEEQFYELTDKYYVLKDALKGIDGLTRRAFVDVTDYPRLIEDVRLRLFECRDLWRLPG